MGNLSCFNQIPSYEKQFVSEVVSVEVDLKHHSLNDSSKRSLNEKSDCSVDLDFIIKLQAILRGFVDRKKSKYTIAKYGAKVQGSGSDRKPFKSRSRKNSFDPTPRSEVKELPPNKVPDYLTSTSKMLQTKLGSFSYGESFKDQSLTSRGPVEMENSAIYTGEWNVSNQRHGKGFQIWADGSMYEGYWSGDKANGKGRLIHENGDVYEGEWKNDKAHGHGIYIHADGAKYEGAWENDKQHGRGTEMWPDGSKYMGEYADGLKNGRGKFQWADGSVYEGEFVNNNLEGTGDYLWSDGRRYEGQWKCNKMHGRGRFTWPDGRVYEGEYLDDKKHGYGVFEWPGGRKYEGYWANGKQHGKGTYYTPSGYREDEWKEGKRVRDS